MMTNSKMEQYNYLIHNFKENLYMIKNGKKI